MNKKDFESFLVLRAATLDAVRPKWMDLRREYRKHTILSGCRCTWEEFINDNYKRIPADIKVNGWYDTFEHIEEPKKKQTRK